MEQNIKNRLLESIGTIYENARNCKLEAWFFEKVDAELKTLSAYFGISDMQSLLVAMVFSLNYRDNKVNFNDMIVFFDCNPMNLLQFSDDFYYLYLRGIFIREKSCHRIKLALSNDQFSINEKVTAAILNNEPLPNLVEEKANDIIEFIERIYQIGEQRENNELSTGELLVLTGEFINSNLHFPLIKTLAAYQFKTIDNYVFLYVLWKVLNGQTSVDVERTADRVFEYSVMKIKYIQQLLLDENALIRQNLIEIVSDNFINDNEIRLTENALKIIENCGIKLLNKKKAVHHNIIEPTQIFSKQLFFNDDENRQLELLKKLLHESNFGEIQKRLEAKGLLKGVTALLHGFPGTGKTETVYQIARETNREIVKVDISQSKSVWFGESEKIIKRIFTNYRSYAQQCELKPILMFNEADAIIGKRKETGSSNVDQTENTIQNIILEELENFDGIFLATTNLVKNLDLAFERRFLFKIEFQKPCIPIKAKIWNSKLPALTENECNALAKSFDFSGGQIDNIIRKNEIYEIIHGISVEYKNILEFCNTELLAKNNSAKIGFTNN